MRHVQKRYFWIKPLVLQTMLPAVLLFVSLLVPAAAEHDADRLKLGVIPFKSPRAIMELYSPVASLLEDILGKSVQVVTARSYEQYMERIYSRHYDIIVLGSTFYFKAHDKSGYQVIARGYPSFHAGIIVLADSNIENIEQLRGKSMAAVHKTDRGGYKLQKKALLKKNIDIAKELTVHFRGDFDSVVYAVLSGQDTSGAIRLDALARPAFSQVKDKLRVIYTSSANPQFPFAVHPEMDPVLRKKIANALASISMDHSENSTILQNLSIQGIEKITAHEMELLRKFRQAEAKKMLRKVTEE